MATALEKYTAIQAEIKQQLALVENKVADYAASCKGETINWGQVGDLSSTLERLKEITHVEE
ncbi:MAG: hypothetical protein H7282_05110 [Cytophagaceae bacterium]|nr:hypothetical protein [Cytophagaceae bacterium]